jgi:hypothetical protein
MPLYWNSRSKPDPATLLKSLESVHVYPVWKVRLRCGSVGSFGGLKQQQA